MGNFNRDRGSSGGRSFGRRDFGGRGRSGGFGGGSDRGPREMFKSTCSNCQKECEVPFRPTNGKPVYCSDCFEKLGRGNQEGGRDNRQESRAPAGNPNGAQLEAISVKLDKIIRLLEPKTEVATISTPVKADSETSSEPETGKAPKVKKSAKKATVKK